MEIESSNFFDPVVFCACHFERAIDHLIVLATLENVSSFYLVTGRTTELQAGAPEALSVQQYLEAGNGRAIVRRAWRYCAV